jgi:putative transposase
MERTFKFRLLPSDTQVSKLLNSLDACRHLHNAALEERITAWKYAGKSINFRMQSTEIPEIMNAYPEFKSVQHHVLQRALKRLDRAYAAFFKHIKARKSGKKVRKVGFPRFKGRNRYRTLEFDRTAFRLVGEHLKLSKVGLVKVIRHRSIPKRAVVSAAYVKRDAVGDWWVMFSVELPDAPVRAPKTAIGVDVGLTHLATCSDGTVFAPTRALKSGLKRLRREQRRLSRRKKGGTNREKQRVIVARENRSIANRRSDWLHKASRKLADSADVVVFEDLRVKNMLQNRCLSRAISDAAWGELVRMTTYKAEGAGGMVLRVNPMESSQECSNCGRLVPKDLSERTHRCVCGTVMDRDLNAAIVIVKRGIGKLQGIVPTFCGVSHEHVAPTDGTSGRNACGDRTSTAAQAAASSVVEAGSPPF